MTKFVKMVHDKLLESGAKRIGIEDLRKRKPKLGTPELDKVVNHIKRIRKRITKEEDKKCSNKFS